MTTIQLLNGRIKTYFSLFISVFITFSQLFQLLSFASNSFFLLAYQLVFIHSKLQVMLQLTQVDVEHTCCISLIKSQFLYSNWDSLVKFSNEAELWFHK